MEGTLHAYRITTDGTLEGFVTRAGAAWAWTCTLDGATGAEPTDWQATAALVAAWRRARKNLV